MKDIVDPGIIQTSSSAAMLPHSLVFLMMNPRLIAQKKKPLTLPNIKKFLNLGYVKLDDLAKFRAAYLETQGDVSVFVKLPFIDSSADDTHKFEEESFLLNEHGGFALKTKKLIKELQ